MTQSEGTGEPTRRDFLYIATGMAGVVGVGSFAWPFIDQMNPDASTLALASIEVNVESLEPGMSLTVKWRGKPVFIRNRTDEEVAEAQAVALDDLKDPVARNANIAAASEATDLDRSAGEGKENWIVMIGSCTIWVACRLARPVNSVAGSAHATVRTTTRLAVFARVRHLRTFRFRRSLSCPTASSKSAEGALDHEQRSLDLPANFRNRKMDRFTPAAAAAGA